MKYSFTLGFFLWTAITFSQPALPDFLQGTWKVDRQEIYEHWDKLNANELKGFAYRLTDGQLKVSEYLDIKLQNRDVIYTATVLSQNRGKGVEFKLTPTDSAFVFENKHHDFPKRIIYQKLSDTTVFVQVSGEKQQGFAYRMTRQGTTPAPKDSTVANPKYDPTLAGKLEANEYGMKKYILVILKTGTNTTTDKEVIRESFSGHMANINRLVEEGTLVVAGPLGKNEQAYRGIFILQHINTPEEARKILQNDPALRNGLLEAELFDWYGSAALPEYLPIADKIWKTKP